MTKKKSTPRQEGREDYQDNPYTIHNPYSTGKDRDEYNAGWSEVELEEARRVASLFTKKKDKGK